MKYHIDCSDRISQYMSITVEIENASDGMIFHLPFWRPGRYEASNYAKNVRNFRARDASENHVLFKKTDHSTWQISMEKNSDIRITYEYYASELTAGTSVINQQLIYINFINCLIYNPQRIKNRCSVQINVPRNYDAATSLSSIDVNTWIASDYYELADSPVLAAPDLNHLTYSAGNIPFHIWYNGDISFDTDKLLSDFRRFSEEQIGTMGDFPGKEYHFLILTATYKLYHGVEHASSTVICLGPAKDLPDSLYDDLIGISSHELFHAWNILTIRPAPLLPYQFNEIPFFDTGFVAEGFTTYLGDLFLVRSGVKSLDWYLAELGKLLKRHYENFGRLHTSVTDSSLDLWLDGYQAGAPHRKSSIYVEGAVIGLMLDLKIRLATDHEKSLLSLMRILYTDFAKKNRGYSAADIQRIAEELSQEPLDDFFGYYVFGTQNTRTLIDELFVQNGLNIVEKMNENPMEGVYGARVSELDNKWKVIKTAPGSDGEKYFRPGDQIIAINGESPININKEILGQATLEIRMQRNGVEKTLTLDKHAQKHFPAYDVVVMDKNNTGLQKWLKL